MLVLGGCVSYGAREVSAMSTYDICLAQVEQGWNLAESSRHALAAELTRRKQSCAPHLLAIQGERDEALYDRMYRNQSP